MPLSKHYGGHGAEVMASMRKTYGPKKAERIFYATENRRKKKRKRKGPSRRTVRSYLASP